MLFVAACRQRSTSCAGLVRWKTVAYINQKPHRYPSRKRDNFFCATSPIGKSRKEFKVVHKEAKIIGVDNLDDLLIYIVKG